MLPVRRPRVPLAIVVSVVSCVLAVCLPSFAGRLAELPWDSSVPGDARRGAAEVMSKEKSSIEDQKNAKGKSFNRFDWNINDVRADGTIDVLATWQKFLDDKMQVERWRYTLAKKGSGYEIADKVKTATNEDGKPIRVEAASLARPIRAFTFTHDQLELKVDSGSYVLRGLGALPSGIYAEVKGRIKLTPIDDYERMYFERRLEGAKVLEDAITGLEVLFYPGAKTFTDLAGVPDGALSAAGGGGTAGPVLQDLVEEASKDLNKKLYTQAVYDVMPRKEREKAFGIRVKTEKYGWVVYTYDPTSVREIFAFKYTGSGSTLKWEMLTTYYAPESRALPLQVRERRREPRLADPIRYDAQFDIDSDKLDALINVELRIMQDTSDLDFFLAGNPVVRYVRTEDGSDVLFIPYTNEFSKEYGFEETSNLYRVLLPQPAKAGDVLRFTVNYGSPKAVTPLSNTYWEIARFGLLPFMGGLAEKSYMRMVIRTPQGYDHIGGGDKLAEETDGSFRYSEWSSDSGFNFPVIGVGKYHKPNPLVADGITYVGYLNRMYLSSKEQIRAQIQKEGGSAADADKLTAQFPEPNPSDMDRQVIQAADASLKFAQAYQTKYPFKTLKLISSPLMGMSAQAPSSVVFIGEQIFWPTTAVTQIFRSMDPTWITAVTAHETAHQWFGGIVTNISSEHYWFVETFAEISSMFYRQWTDDTTGLKGTLQYWRNASFFADYQKSVMDDLLPREPGKYTLLRYTKGPYVFWMLREYYGEQKLLHFLRKLVNSYNGDLISTSDVQIVAEQVFGEDMDWFFDQYIRDIGVPVVRFRFDPPRQAEDGKGWLITGRLEQTITGKDGDVIAGKYFKKLLVPLTIDTDGGPVKEKYYLDGPGQDVRIRLESKPKGSVKVNDGDVCYMKVKPM